MTCPECKSANIEMEWQEATYVPEWEKGTCNECGHEWNECVRDDEPGTWWVKVYGKRATAE